jgi:hypothetical protein
MRFSKNSRSEDVVPVAEIVDPAIRRTTFRIRATARRTDVTMGSEGAGIA